MRTSHHHYHRQEDRGRQHYYIYHPDELEKERKPYFMFRIIFRHFRSIEIIIIITIIYKLSKICVPSLITHKETNTNTYAYNMIYLINHLHAIHIQKRIERFILIN